MGKKTNNLTNLAAPAKPAARKIPLVPAKPAGLIPKKPRRTAKKAAIADEDIALRAYFIAERRRQSGQSGDEHQDWVEAERQLRSERKSLK